MSSLFDRVKFPGGERARYRSKPLAATRTSAQLLLLKPAIWRLLDVHVHGKENLDDLEGAFIAIANHSSHFDAPLIIGSLPRKHSEFLSAGAAADYFFDAWWKAAPTALFFNAFPVDRKGTRGRKGMAGNLLSDGVPLLLFPEGTRSRTGAMAPFKPGAAALCISRDVPAVPIALVGAYAAWPSTQKSLPRNRPTVHVVIGRPMHPHPGEIAHQFNERLRRQVLELHDSTARAYGMKTLAEYAHTTALEQAASTPTEETK
ncbi:lysophospholipid acyltransferase family protein [Luteococcus sp. OSA5]|uniref:lysophospholipid acyltransferase family protein n=1 Tax=Luteococcus sp. OSA5 TaxID=3401630 RepID=UPI003B431CF9